MNTSNMKNRLTAGIGILLSYYNNIAMCLLNIHTSFYIINSKVIIKIYD